MAIEIHSKPIKVRFYQATSGRIYLTANGCDTDLTHPQIMSMFTPIFASIDVQAGEFSLDDYQAAYSLTGAMEMLERLERSGIKVDSELVRLLERRKNMATKPYDNSPYTKMLFKELSKNLSVRAYNVLRCHIHRICRENEWNYVQSIDKFTIGDLLEYTPSLRVLRNCGIVTATEIIRVFYQLGIPVERWMHEFEDEAYFKEHFAD